MHDITVQAQLLQQCNLSSPCHDLLGSLFIFFDIVDIVQVEVDEKQGRKGRGRGAKQASTHTLLQVSQDPCINPGTPVCFHLVQTVVASAVLYEEACMLECFFQ